MSLNDGNNCRRLTGADVYGLAPEMHPHKLLAHSWLSFCIFHGYYAEPMSCSYVLASTDGSDLVKVRWMMKTLLFGITILAVLAQTNPAYATASGVKVEESAQPITGLINDWSQFRAGIIARTRQFDKYSDIKPYQLPGLTQSLTGKWNMINHRGNSGYKIHAVLDLKKNHHFVYNYTITAGHSHQDWLFSGRWQEKNKILMLLIKKSRYPGVATGDVKFWRLLQIGHNRLVYVRTAAHRMQAMRRVSDQRGS